MASSKDSPPSGETRTFPIAGVGASAGGLEAFIALLERMPADTGMAFVLVQHLDPAHESELARLLGRATSMPTHEVTDNLRVLPNNVYVIPPNARMTISGGVLKLKPRQLGHSSRHAIDAFFESLAEDQVECAIGVVLSGTASDGTLGLEAIKAEGGITFAQDGSAKYDSMPRSAVAAGCVDYVLSPTAIAYELARIAAHPFVQGAQAPAIPDGSADLAPDAAAGAGPSEAAGEALDERDRPAAKADGTLARIVALLNRHSGVDFRLYKPATIQRRIARRMVLTKHLSYADYAKFLRHNPSELDTLYADALIGVTSFFRNPEAFDALQRSALSALLQRERSASIRAWVLGCSTGQEAYSLAILFAELVAPLGWSPKVQIFATDLNEGVLETARTGLYPKAMTADVTPERLKQFFVEESGGYRVAKRIRETVVFAQHNLISDPPFSRLDLISCRNVLIYLDATLQKRIYSLFHYALKPKGFLFLGASESVGKFSDQFEPADRKHRIFWRKPALSTLPRVEVSAGSRPRPRIASAPERAIEPIRPERDPQREADRHLVNQFAPPGVLIDEHLQILQFRGNTGAFLQPAIGKATFNVLKMAREGLMLPLREAIAQAKRDNVSVRTGDVPLPGTPDGTLVLHVIPLRNLREPHFLVLFDEGQNRKEGSGIDHARPLNSRRRAVEARKPARPDSVDDEQNPDFMRARLSESERELAETRDHLQFVQEQSESINEELQASNEEAQSANEELLSINEELQTSKEELESTNEELTTVNDEINSRNVELARVVAEMHNLQVSIPAAIVVLNRDRTIRRFTPQAEEKLDLVEADIGRRIGSIRHELQTASGSAPADRLDLEALACAVIDSGAGQEREVRDGSGRWYLLRMRPFVTLDNAIDGALLALIDVDELKRSEQAADTARRYAEATFNAMFEPYVVLGGDLRVRSANEVFYRTFQVDPANTEGRLVYELGDGQWNIPALRTLLEDVLPRNESFERFEVSHTFETIGERVMLLSGRRLELVPAAQSLVILTIEDVTERRRAAARIRASEERFRLLAETMPQMIFTAAASGEVNYCNPQWLEYAGVGFDALRDWGWTQLLHPEDRTPTVGAWKKSLQSGRPFLCEHRLRRADGEFRWHVSRAIALSETGAQVPTWVCASTDINDVKESDQRKDEFLATLAHELRNPLAPIGNALHILERTGGESGRPAVEMLQRQFRQAVRLMDDLLDVSRISRGKFMLHRVRMDLGVGLTQAVESVQVHLQRMEQTLALEMPESPVYLDADPARLIQIVGNLLNNASKFTERGGKIALKATHEGADVVIRVIDDGIGIDERQLGRIFDMFVQVDTSLERTRGGLGIGLTLVKRLVEMHGGSIVAHSEGIGRGAEFVVRLPAAEGAPKSAEAGDRAPVNDDRSRRILVVDDNVDAAQSLAELLKICGHEVHVAHDGLQAVASASAVHPDVVLLDIGLPRLNGYEAGRRIRAHYGDKPLLLVALTGWGQEADRQRSQESGFDFHLVKPVDPVALTRLLNGAPGSGGSTDD